MDVDTGEIRWHYQFTPHDLWDYDSTMENILFEKDGRKLLAHVDKNGYFFVLDRTNGELVQVFPFVDRITWGEISPGRQGHGEGLPGRGGRPGALLAGSGRRQGVDPHGLQPARPG